MKKYISLFLAVLCLLVNTHFQLYGQNVPDPTSTGPLPATYPLAVLPAPYLPDNEHVNFTRVFVPMVKTTNITDPYFLRTPPSTAKYACKMYTEYVNGFGTTYEKISRGTNAAGGNDIASFIDLRPQNFQYAFLPFPVPTSSRFIASPASTQRAYYNSKFPSENKRAYNRSEIIYPSDIPTTVAYAPGSSFEGNSIGNIDKVTIYTGDENIPIYKINPTTDQINFLGFYSAQSLKVVTTEDPSGAISRVFTDDDGRTVCNQVLSNFSGTPSWLTTYNVYDDFGKLRHVITPKAFNSLVGASASSFATVFSNLSQLIYTYNYDKRGRISSSFQPGKLGYNKFIYDKKGRVILSQTPLLAAQTTPLYRFCIYDNAGHIIADGLTKDTRSAAELQDIIDGVSGSISSGTLLFYLANEFTGSVYPTLLPNTLFDNYYYYDDYPFVKEFCHDFDAVDVGLPANYCTDYVATKNTKGLLTVTCSRVKSYDDIFSETDKWTSTVVFYDRSGKVIQTQSTDANISLHLSECLAGATDINWDVACTKYDFSGNERLNIYRHYSDPFSTDNPITIYDKYFYEYASTCRLKTVHRRINDGAYILLSEYKYDELGNVIYKSLGNVEKQKYEYNIRGQIEAINRNYTNSACSEDAAYVSFGCILSYDWGFTQPSYNGSISGIKWRGKASNLPLRSYGYEYNIDGTFKKANYKEYSDGPWATPCMFSTAHSWNNTFRDYSVFGVDYDANGNMLSMSQMGMNQNPDITTSAPVLLDQLTYSYSILSNKLTKVSDAVSADYKNGDFLDRNSGTDYDYDQDGNLSKDKNKNIDLIVYNEDDQPILIRKVEGTLESTIRNTYTADGRLCRKEVSEATGTTYNNYYYTYNGPIVYKNDEVQYILHPEGRCRFDQSTGLFIYDYFVKDHLGNVRNVVTGNKTNAPVGSPIDILPIDDLSSTVHDAVASGVIVSSGDLNAEYQSGFSQVRKSYKATYESSLAQIEEALFSNISATRVLKPASASQEDVYAGKINGATAPVGPSILLKVSPGDSFDISVDSYYEDSVASNYVSSANLLSALISNLSGGIAAVNAAERGVVDITKSLNSVNFDGYDVLLQEVTDPSAPRAYLNYLFFDEQMQFHPEWSGAVQLQKAAGQWTSVSTGGPIAARGSGHLLVYVSMATEMDMHIDLLDVTHYKGSQLEEYHYYPHGLAVNMDASFALPLKNNFKYQGKELQDDLSLGLYDFHARQYDPQIGRFWGADPLSQMPSEYTGMANDPANMIDPTGCAAGSGNFYNPVAFNNLAGNTPINESSDGTKMAEQFQMEDFRSQQMLLSFVLEYVAKQGFQATVQLPEVVCTTTESKQGETKSVPTAASEPPKSKETAKPKNWFGRAWSTIKKNADKIVDGIQLGLDAIGMLPVVGEIADGINAVVYFARGDKAQGLLSLAAMIPLAGNGATAMKLGAKLEKKAAQIIAKKGVKEVEQKVAQKVEQGLASEATEAAAKGGVYDLGTSLGKYVGQSKNVMSRVSSHFAKGGKLSAGELTNAVFHSMPNSTKLEREVYEQFLINKYGIDNILNVRNPMGGRMDLYKSMIDGVINKFGLPR